MPPTAFPVDPELTAIAIAYKNPDIALIADGVLPRSPVGSTLFQYTTFNDVSKLFTLPQMRQGPTAKVNRVDLSGQRLSAETDDLALSIPLSFYDTNANGKGFDPRKMATEALTSWVLLQREADVGSLVFDPNAYPTGNKTALATADQFQTIATSKPIDTINAGLDAALVRPNVLVIGQLGWRYLRSHPHIVSAVNGNAGNYGLANRQQVADLFEVQEILVGTSWVNTAKPGAAANMTRVWGAHMAAIYRDRAAASAGGLTFGFTAQYGNRVAGSYPDPDVGLRGGEIVKVGESTKNLIVAPYAAYFWQNVAA